MSEQNPETITAEDLEALDETSEAPTAEASEAPTAEASEATPAPEASEAPTAEEREPTIAELKSDLKVAQAREAKARKAYEKAKNVTAAISTKLAELRNQQALPLHELNRLAREQTRVEDGRRFRAVQAIEDLKGHVRPGKRQYPVHPSAKGVIRQDTE